MPVTQRKYILFIPSEMVYLVYDNAKQEFSTSFNANEASVIIVSAEEDEGSAIDNHAQELNNKLNAMFRQYFSQRQLLMNSIVVEIVESMVRTVVKVENVPAVPFGDFIE